ncbi:hypothetical protein PILCRDRAFT_824331 [Piloderma croceum F 1598]|uniref:Uncharacterized protein n=1 Tax=Piloderma croceum (strain F 1598) TaxID=765440 RepID=A0A0C3BMA7_PILCF|nr:hypothetical protein PILCRDRAFT_824331 [Piloderma croceum F 1598]
MPLGFIINLVAYSLQSWSVEVRCKHYVRYEGSMTVIGIEVVNIMMLLRVHALYYRKSQIVIGLVASILLVETGMNIYLLMNGIAVPHTSGVHSCSMIFDPSIGNAASASAWIPLLYDTVVFFLTLYRILPSIQHREAGHVVRTIFKDGLLYYSVIFCVTLVLTIQITASPAGIKNITAQLELLLTVAMMSRITLNLKKEAHMPRASGRHWDDAAVEITFSRDRSFTDATIRTRVRSYSSSDYLTGGADTGVNFTRSISPRRLSTIRSERNWVSGAHTPENGSSPVAEGRDLGDMSWLSHTVIEEPEEHELSARHEGDEES